MVCSRYPKEYRYYEAVLKRKCFRKLKNNVWERKTKWILLEKADCHYRAKLLNECFNSWIEYLNECLKEKINSRVAEAFLEERLKSKVLSALKRNREQTDILMRICRRKFEKNLTYKCCHQWKHYTQKRAKVREIKVLADRIREEKLRMRCLYLWSCRLREKCLLQKACKNAKKSYEMKLKDKCFNLWRTFAEKRICKAKIGKLAESRYKEKLKEKFISCWKRYAAQRRRYRYQIKIIHKFYENFLLENYLSRWVTAYKKFKFDRKIRSCNLAVDFYNRKLLVKSFKSLRKIRQKKRARDEKLNNFREVHERIRLNFYLNLWLEKRRKKMVGLHLENKAKQWRKGHLRELFLSELCQKYQERVEEKEEMANVIKYYNAIIIHRAFRAWVEATSMKIKRRVQYENAGKFHSDKLTRKAFDSWKKFSFRRSRKKMLANYYRNVLLSRVMEGWKAFLEEHRSKLLGAENLQKQFNVKLMRNAFGLWRDELKTLHSKSNLAVDFHEKLMLSRAFRTWKRNARTKAMHKSRYNRNRIILSGMIIKDAMFCWYELYSLKLNLKPKLEGFRLKRENQLLRCYFNIWQGFVKKMNFIRENERYYPQIRSSLLAEDYLVIISEAVKSKIILKKKGELAKRAEKRILKRRYLKKWLSFICWKRERILKCMTEVRKTDSIAFDPFVPVGKTKRRQPIIPGFLKIEYNGDLFEDCINQQTSKAVDPVNNKPLIIDKEDAFVSPII